jgi:transposase
MEHVGIDLGATKCHVVRLSAAGEVLERRAIGTGAMELWMRGLEPSRVVMETCTQSPAMARLAQRSGHTVVVIAGTLVRTLGVGARGIKTDDRDADVLARASLRIESLPGVHLRSEQATHQRELVSTRGRLVKSRAQVALSVKSHMRGRLITIRGRASSQSFCETVRSVLLKTEEGLPAHIEMLLKTFEFLTTQIDELQEQIEKIACESKACQKLMTIPGVGPYVALSFVSTIDEVSRFESADKLGSFLALTPGEHTTGGKIRRTGTIHAGPVWLKSALVQAAWSMWRTTPQAPMVLWARGIAEKRGKRIAIVALARKLATVMWAMWKRDQSYCPELASSVRASSTSELESHAAIKKNAKTTRATASEAAVS